MIDYDLSFAILIGIYSVCIVLAFVFGFKTGRKSQEKVVRYIVESKSGKKIDTINVEEDEHDMFQLYAYGDEEDIEEVLYEDSE